MSRNANQFELDQRSEIWTECAEEIILFILTGEVNFRYRTEKSKKFTSVQDLIEHYAEYFSKTYKKNQPIIKMKSKDINYEYSSQEIIDECMDFMEDFLHIVTIRGGMHTDSVDNLEDIAWKYILQQYTVDSLSKLLLNEKDEKEKKIKMCICGKIGKLYKCSLCMNTLYCNIKCQKADYEKHKLVCKRN